MDHDIELQIALDFPQLFSAYGGPFKLGERAIEHILQCLRGIRHKIKSMHIWGKRKSSNGNFIAHNGDLNSYFDNQQNMKKVFLAGVKDLFDDDLECFFVPEVNSCTNDLRSIIADLESIGFDFINT